MWIKNTTSDVIYKRSHDVHLCFLWKTDDIPLHVMDNHMAAAWCWMQECDIGRTEHLVPLENTFIVEEIISI